ncbi:helix-turn-helix transcriptional regulator [Longispora albida]|uniref:helix-turn-helix transcriptional regulator n=1 Tax=Longispora albida TaxID=203523 RepID=UPI00039FABBB|nr:WYL domain-containing protein [Longispora albida]
MSRTRTERLVNLVICLLSTRRFLTAAQIAQTVPGYEHDPSLPKDHEAFQRKFERDKAELRMLGVPLETGTSSVFDAEPGYRIAQRDYALPEVELEPDEAAAVGIAAKLWRDAGLAAAASSGLVKLRAAGIDVDPHATLGIEPQMSVEPAFDPVTAAVRERRIINFDYQVPAEDAPRTRRLQPWGAVCWRGRWYVVGHDLDRRAARCFRLSRVVGKVRAAGEPGAFSVPEGVDLIDHVARFSTASPVERTGRATVRLLPGRANGIRRRADRLEGDVATLAYSDPEHLAELLAGYGPDLVVLDPPEVRDAVVKVLTNLACAHTVRSEVVA